MTKPLFLLLASSALLGASTLFFQKSTKAIGAENTTFWYYVFGFLLAVLFATIKGVNIVAPKEIGWPLLAAGSMLVSVYFFNLSLKNTNISLAATVRSLAFIFTIFYELAYSKSSFSWQTITGSVLAIAAVFTLSKAE